MQTADTAKNVTFRMDGGDTTYVDQADAQVGAVRLFAIRDKFTRITRRGATTLDQNANGGTVVQVNHALAATEYTTLRIGGSDWMDWPYYGSVGPVAVSPARITDAETVLLDAGLTAGWGGQEVFRFFKDRSYRGTLVLPLAGNSVGYVVT
jgi:hypothetical protein